jgi:glycosyltransferase involved in cell wall biosynthesis
MSEPKLVESNKRSPKFSILIPTYNVSGEELERCLHSLVVQAGLALGVYDVETLIYDDGSSDQYIDQINEVITKYLNSRLNISVKSFNHEGRGSIRNRLMEDASGEWFIFIDADDRVSDNYLISFLELDPKVNLVFSKMNRFGIDKDGNKVESTNWDYYKIYSEDLLNDYMYSATIGCLQFKAELVKEGDVLTLPFNENFFEHEDIEFYTLLVAKTDYEHTYVYGTDDEAYYDYFISPHDKLPYNILGLEAALDLAYSLHTINKFDGYRKPIIRFLKNEINNYYSDQNGRYNSLVSVIQSAAPIFKASGIDLIAELYNEEYKSKFNPDVDETLDKIKEFLIEESEDTEDGTD